MNLLLGAILVLVLLTALLAGRWRRPSSPASRQALLARTFARLLEGERRSVLEEMRGLYRESGQDVGIGLALGMILRAVGKHQVAIRTHRSLTTHPALPEPLNAAIHTELAADYMEIGLLERAHNALERALALGPPDERLARYGERILARLGKWDEAVKLVRDYGKRSGNNVTRRLGLLRYQQGEQHWRDQRPEDALSAYKKAFQVHERCVPAYLGITRYHCHAGKPKKALSFLEKRRQLFEEMDWLYFTEFRDVAIQLGNPTLFVDQTKAYLEGAQRDWRTRLVLAVFLTETGSYEEAAGLLLDCLEQAPQTLLVHQKLWSLMLRWEEPWQLMREYREKIRQEPVFRDPWICQSCGFTANDLPWNCPSCFRPYSFTERKV